MLPVSRLWCRWLVEESRGYLSTMLVVVPSAIEDNHLYESTLSRHLVPSVNSLVTSK